MSAKATDFTVRLDGFEGPLELLLSLVEERKLHISRVSLAAVADSFVEHLNQADNFQNQKDKLVNFLVIAATLMLIKSISLLPNLEVSPEEEEDIADLEKRLQLYQHIRQAARSLGQLFGRQIIFSPRDRFSLGQSPQADAGVFAPSAELTPQTLAAAFREVLANLPIPERLPEVEVAPVVSLEEVVADLARRVQTALKLSFRQYIKNPSDRVAVIVSFLGLLELVKQGIVKVNQAGHFQDISLEATEPATLPRYE